MLQQLPWKECRCFSQCSLHYSGWEDAMENIKKQTTTSEREAEYDRFNPWSLWMWLWNGEATKLERRKEVSPEPKWWTSRKKNRLGLWFRFFKQPEKGMMLHTDLPERLAKISTGHKEFQGVLERTLKVGRAFAIWASKQNTLQRHVTYWWSWCYITKRDFSRLIGFQA